MPVSKSLGIGCIYTDGTLVECQSSCTDFVALDAHIGPPNKKSGLLDLMPYFEHGREAPK